MANLLSELKRRNVVRVGVAYIVVGWVTMQVGDILFTTFEAPPWVGKSLAVLILLGFPFACLFAWAFELTPDGIKKTVDVDSTTAASRAGNQTLDRVIIVALVIALGYFIWERNAGGPTPVDEITDKSIAVLPFANLATDTEQDWFADGLTDEILNSLSRTPDLLVASRTSSFQYKGANADIKEIAGSLGVAHVLKGSVRRDGERLRVTVQLVRAQDGFQLWSETFDRLREDVIEVQEQIAFEIANALQTAMDPAALREMTSAGTTSVAAYESYLEGAALAYRGSEIADLTLWDEAMESFARSVEHDPDFPLPHDFRARYWESHLPGQIAHGRLGLSSEELVERFTEAIDAAIATAHTPTQALRFKARKSYRELSFREALEFSKTYLEQYPTDPRALELYLGLAATMQDYESLRQFFDRLPRIMQLDPAIRPGVVQNALFVGRVDDAIQFARAGIETSPRHVFLTYQGHRAMLWGGQIEEARPLLELLRKSDFPRTALQLAELRQACAEGSEEAVKTLVEEGADQADFGPFEHFIYLQIMGRPVEAHQVLIDANLELHTLVDLLIYPYFNHSHFPALVAILERQGIERSYTEGPPYACGRTESIIRE